MADRGEGIVNLLFLFISFIRWTVALEVDPNGYIAYCPCMGRFGNQADHFLGALGFAKKLNRTLILPPWVEYRRHESKSVQVPFDTYFKVNSLREYHSVITMETFMKELAPTIWPTNERVVFCYMARGSENDCNAKDGSPFGPFWDTFNIDFVRSELYGPLHYDVHYTDMAQRWNEKYPSDRYPIIAFTGAPASFPVQLDNRDLHQYLKWSQTIEEKATGFIRNVLPRGPFVGIHLRNGVDWTRACEHIGQSPNLFAAAQCLGYRNELGVVTPEICFPSLQTILRQLKRVVKMEKAVAIFVASDDDHMIEVINKGLKRFKARAYRRLPSEPHVDLAILGRSNHFIANCVSSFSAFVVRERKVHDLAVSFWGFSDPKTKHDEL